MSDEQPETACAVVGCEASPLGGPEDDAEFCAECRRRIEDERREMRREGGGQ